MKELWTEKYRPKTVDGYVFRDAGQKKQIQGWIKEGSIPHLLLSGTPGIGKTTLAKLLLNELEISEYDILEINASRERGIGEVRERITNFVQMIPFSAFKCVLLDEADRLTPEAQDALKGVMEEYSSHSRFILTCNSQNKIVPALHSRCQQMHFASIDQVEYTARVATILVEEGVEFDLDVLDTYVKAVYPDLRKCINLVQQNSVEGMLVDPKVEDSGVSDYKIEMVELFKKGKIQEARKLLCGRATAEEMPEIYRWCLGHNIDRKVDIRAVVEALESGQVVGIANGRAEFGPRALGNRSLLADPRGENVKDRVNAIKKREPFRPFAPIRRKSFFSLYFHSSIRTNQDYMQYADTCIRPGEFTAICHIDETSRVQTIDQLSPSITVKILEAWYLRTRCPMLLNTSLNIKGEPLVNTWADAERFSQLHNVAVF